VKSNLLRHASAGALLAATFAAGGAAAQSATSNSAEFNGGYGRIQGTENIPFQPVSQYRGLIDGVLQAGDDNSTFDPIDSDGTGAGYGDGSTNADDLVTVIVTTDQKQPDNLSASPKGAVINGEIDLDD